MKLRDFIVSEAIVPELKATDRDGALRELAMSLAKAGALPEAAVDEIVAALIKREQNGSTGFGKGVAVPHVKHAKVKQMAGTIGRSVAGIDFAALDHQPVFSIFLLLSPENQPQQHLQAMNIVFSNLQKDMFRRFLRQSTTREAIVDLLDEADQRPVSRSCGSFELQSAVMPNSIARHRREQLRWACTPGRPCSSSIWPTSFARRSRSARAARSRTKPTARA